MKTQSSEQTKAMPPKLSRTPVYQETRNAVPEPMEPSILGRAHELLNHVDNLERENSLLRGSLFGVGSVDQPKGIEPSSLEGMLADACSRVACMVGDMATINGKVAR